MSPSSAKRALREFRAPGEAAAEQRAWAVVRTAYVEREPISVVGRPKWRLALAPVVAVLLAGVALSPAGASVKRLGDSVKQLITGALVGVRHPAPVLSSLPSPGRLLVSGPGGTWTAAADGSIRHLGAWSQASWSPRGLYVAVASSDRLAAVDQRGDVQWAIARPDVRDASWFAPSGYRVAYLSRQTLRVIAGDGTGDHLLATRVTGVAPAWRPGHSFQLAYVTDRNRIVVRDADTEQVIWSTAALRARPRRLLWSNDGRRLVVVSAQEVLTYTGEGTRQATLHLAGPPAGDAALSPDARLVALILGGREMAVVRIGYSHTPTRQLLALAGLRDVAWSPSGGWLVVSLPAADQWIFVRALGTPRVAAVARIAQQFSAGSGATVFPRLEGWCCTSYGSAG